MQTHALHTGRRDTIPPPLSAPLLYTQIRLGQLVTRVAVAELAPFTGDDSEGRPAPTKSASQLLLEKCALIRSPGGLHAAADVSLVRSRALTDKKRGCTWRETWEKVPVVRESNLALNRISSPGNPLYASRRVRRRKGDGPSTFAAAAGGFAAGASPKGGGAVMVAIQSAENTVDVRGEYADEVRHSR